MRSATGEAGLLWGRKSPKSDGKQTVSVQNERNEWKGLTNRPKPSVALTKDRPQWTSGSSRPNDAREAYTAEIQRPVQLECRLRTDINTKRIRLRPSYPATTTAFPSPPQTCTRLVVSS